MAGYRPRDPDAGLTLVEMLAALAVLAAVGMAGFTVLETIVRVHERTQGRIERLQRLDLALLLMGRDVAQSHPESILVDADRLSLRRPTTGGALALSYGVADGALQRRILADGAGEAVTQRLIDGASGVAFRFLLEDRTWSTTWPPEDVERDGPGERDPAAPLGIEFTLTLDSDGGEATLTRLLEPPRTPLPVPERRGYVPQ